MHRHQLYTCYMILYLMKCTFSLAIFFATPTSTKSPTVTLRSGIYRGLATQLPNSSITVHKYLGIPFAVPPLGKLRFAPPEPPLASKYERQADKLPPACIQNSSSKSIFESEDCLYLNIFTRASGNESTQSNKTVMVWLFGGGFQYGHISQALYDGSSFASNQDVIIVAPNYRVNAFGFPGEIPEIPSHSRNPGLLDQRLALLFVQENIDRFGGDPTKITLFGESSGARSADFHLLTMKKDPPFRAVIMQSGSAELTPLADARKAEFSATRGLAFHQLAKAVDCNDKDELLSCMRAVSATRIKEAVREKGLYFGSVDDSGVTTVPDQAQVRRAHQAANVSLLIGTNADEVRVSLSSWQNRSLSEYLEENFGSRPEMKVKLEKAYKPKPKSIYKTEFDAVAAIGTDMSFTCITSREASISATSGYPTWRYLFNASYPNTERFPGSGAIHASEIQFVFGNLADTSTPEEFALSKVMQKTWGDFAKMPDIGPGWARVHTAGALDLGHFHTDGKLRQDAPALLDRNCRLFEKLYEGRA